MDVRIIWVIAGGSIVVGWSIFCGIRFFRRMGRMPEELHIVARVKCEKCGTEYTVNGAEYGKSHMVKSRGTIKTTIKKGTLISSSQYSYFAKKFYCPHCMKRKYANVLNLDEIRDRMYGTVLKEALRCLAEMLLVGMLVLAMIYISVSFFDRSAKKQAAEQRQEYYEEIKKRYDPTE